MVSAAIDELVLALPGTLLPSMASSISLKRSNDYVKSLYGVPLVAPYCF